MAQGYDNHQDESAGARSASGVAGATEGAGNDQPPAPRYAESTVACVELFDPIATNSNGRETTTHSVSGQHVREDFG
jgi:hypothetical protein